MPSPSSLLDAGEVIEETPLELEQVKQLVLLEEWRIALHVVLVVDNRRREERIVTVYEPDPARWFSDFRRRRR